MTEPQKPEEKISFCSIHQVPNDDCKICNLTAHITNASKMVDGPPRIEPTKAIIKLLLEEYMFPYTCNPVGNYSRQGMTQVIVMINNILLEQWRKGRETEVQ